MTTRTRTKREAVAELARTVRRVLGLTTPVTLWKVVASVRRMGGTFEDVPVVDGAYEHQLSVRSTGRTTFVVYERLEHDTTDHRRTRSILNTVYEALIVGFGNPERWNDDSRYVMSYARPGFTREQMDASQFVAEVTMPEAEIREWSGRGEAYLAERFGVPLETMRNRMELRGLFRGVA